MTTWAVPGVADFARKAGWAGDALADAVSVVMAATGGADHYRFNPGYLPATERKGLFAMLDSEHELGPDADLFSPAVAALAAHQRWQDEGKTWRWHLAWVSGEAGKQLAYVVASLAHAARHQVPAAPGTFEDSVHRILYRTEQIKEAGASVRRRHG